MRIGFDARMIDHPGIGTYIRNLLPGLISLKKGAEFVLYGNPEQLSGFKNLAIIKWTTPIYSFREIFINPFAQPDLDLVHIPHFNFPLTAKQKSVITIHDMIYLEFPEYSSYFKARAVKIAISNAVKKAEKIIAVSENTRKDIIKYFPWAKNKIEVIHEAANPLFAKIADTNEIERVKGIYSLPENPILFVGALKGHKNIERLIEAYLCLKSEGIKNRLVIIGRFRPRECGILKKIQSTDALYLSEIPIGDLAVIYNLAGVLVVPSLYEGFGLPVLEAMASGLAVACSNISSLPEVAGNAADYFDPYNIKAMAESIKRVLLDTGYRKSLIEKGYENVKRFSWDKTAESTFQVYKKAQGR